VASTGPAVLAVLVATDGASWLPDVLSNLEAQTYPNLDVLAIDNGSRDGSRAILLDRLSEERVLVAERDLGFAGAVSMALDADSSGDLVLLLHDDVALAPDAVEHLVAALVEDPRLAIVGPKLLDWDDPQRLQQVGWSVDITGRQDMGLERDERDQGQRDEPQHPLVVSSAGMLVRRDVFESLGRMDRRYHVFRDDLDVCWRAWLAGWEVGVVPTATARHRRAAADYHRLGQSAFLGPRYFAERNTLATLLKNYGASRLAVVLPLFFLVGVAKVLGFVATRQVGAAWQTIRAWAWNVVHLPGTLDLRRDVQRLRRRSDADLRRRFVQITPRVRAYAEAVADRLTGGDLRVPDDAWDATAEPRTVTARVLATLRRHPVGWMAAGLVLVGVIVTVPLLVSGALRGGTLAPFPESGRVFLEDYVSSWHDAGAFGTAANPSPAQAMLGLLQLLALDSAYLASRLLVLGAVPAAWVLSLRAIRPLTPTRGPRVAAATVYVLSPAALAAVRSGRVGALVVLVGLPAFASAVTTALGRRPSPPTAWRAAAVATLAGAAIIAFEPVTALGVAAAWVALGLWVAIRADVPERRRRALARLGAIVFGTIAVLFPWSLSLFQADSPVLGGLTRPGADPAPFWRWLLQAPELSGYAGLVAGSGIVIAGVFGLLFAARRRAGTVVALWTAAVLGAVFATATSRAGGNAWVWPGVPLLLTSAALAALFAVGLRSAARALEVHDFGWRQVGAVAMVAGAVVGSLASLASLAGDQWSAYTVADPPLPAFISTVAMTDPDVRVLALTDVSGAVGWDVETASGPTMAAFGTPRPEGVVRTVTGAIQDVIGGSDPGAAGRLGLLNIRYVVVPDEGRSEALERALAAQLDLEPRPVADGLVYEVAAWIPRVAFVPRATVDAIARRGVPPTAFSPEPFERVGTATFRGDVDGRGAILVSETEVGAWHARLADGRDVAASSSAGLVRIDVPADVGVVEVTHGAQARRTLAVTLQLVAVLLVMSVMLRPPSFALEETP
jgi:GT2 family glycosyltransferase